MNKKDQVEVEPDENVLGDVFSPEYERKVLFSGEIQIEPSKLKRRKPHVVIEPYKGDLVNERPPGK